MKSKSILFVELYSPFLWCFGFIANHFSILPMNNHLMERHIMKFRTCKFSMLSFFADLAFHNLELINNWFIFVTKKTKMHVIHVGFPQNGDKFIIGKRVYHRILKGFGLVCWPFSCQKLQTEKNGIISVTDFYSIDDFFIEFTAPLFDCISYLSLAKDQEIILIINSSQSLKRMTNSHLNLLSQWINSFIDKVVEERKLLEETFVWFF